MSDYYPSYATIFIIFYCIFWFYKDTPPFSFWWIVGVIIVQSVISILLLKITKNIMQK